VQPPAAGVPTPVDDGNAVVFDRPSAVRVVRVTKYVEGMIQQRPGPRNQPRDLSPAGAWAKLQSGNSISGASGSSLGSGSVTLCSMSSGALTDDGDVVTAYNAGGSITGPAYLKLGRVGTDWSVDVAPCS
jgi:hypothetical protein